VSATELDISLREIERLVGGPESGGGAMLDVDSLAACLATLPLHERLGMPALALWGLVRAQPASLSFAFYFVLFLFVFIVMPLNFSASCAQYDSDNTDIDPFDADESSNADEPLMTAASPGLPGSGGPLSMRSASIPSVPYTSPSAQDLARVLAASAATSLRPPIDDSGTAAMKSAEIASAPIVSSAHSSGGPVIRPSSLTVPASVAAVVPRVLPEQTVAMPLMVPKVAPIIHRPERMNDDSTDDLDDLLAGTASGSGSRSDHARHGLASIPPTSSARPGLSVAPKPAVSANSDDDDLDALLSD
jgi:hypothetical protein